MTITELIEKLEAIKAEHGDIEVIRADGEHEYDDLYYGAAVTKDSYKPGTQALIE